MHGYGSLTFFSILWFFVWVLWIFLLIRIISDVFRSPDLTGGARAGWTLMLVLFPFVGALLYLVFRGSDMHVREDRTATDSRQALHDYFAQADGRPHSAADEITKLANLRDHGLLTDGEFTSAKFRVLAGSAAG